MLLEKAISVHPWQVSSLKMLEISGEPRHFFAIVKGNDKVARQNREIVLLRRLYVRIRFLAVVVNFLHVSFAFQASLQLSYYRHFNIVSHISLQIVTVKVLWGGLGKEI